MLTEDIIAAEIEENELRDITCHNEALLKSSCVNLEFNRVTFVKCKLSGCGFCPPARRRNSLIFVFAYRLYKKPVLFCPNPGAFLNRACLCCREYAKLTIYSSN